MAKLSLPNLESPHLRNDAPMLRVMNYAVFGFILLSSLTVFLGLRAYMSDYVAGYEPVYRYFSYGTAYLFGALIPDFANATIMAWFIRSLLIGDYKSIPAKLILAAALLICYLLAIYSYNMSQISAGALVDDLRGEERVVDVMTIDSSLDRRIETIQRAADREYERVQQEYDKLITATDQQFYAQRAPYVLEIERLEKNRKPANSEWIDREINLQKKKMQSIQEKRSNERNRLTLEKNQELNLIRQNRRDREQAALAARDTTFTQEHALVQSSNARKNAVSRQLKLWVSNIAGFAVWVMLALVAILQVLRVRNQQLPVYIPVTNLLPKIWEVIMALPHLGGTILLHVARQQYQRATKIDLPPPPAPHRQWDYGSFRPALLPFSDHSSTPTNRLPISSNLPNKVNGNKPAPGILDKLISMLYQKPDVEHLNKPSNDNKNRGDNKNRDNRSTVPETLPLDQDASLSENSHPTQDPVNSTDFSNLSENVADEKNNPKKYSDNVNGAKDNKNRDLQLDLVSENGVGEGTVPKVRIGRKWYTRRQCSKKLSDARRGAEKSVTEKARQRNLERIEIFEAALRLFNKGKTERKLVTA